MSVTSDIAEWVQKEPMDYRIWDKSWNNRIWERDSIRNNLMDGSNTWNRNWRGNWRRDGLTSHSIESVRKAVGVRSDKRWMETSRFWNRHGSVSDSGAGKASSNERIQMPLGATSWKTILDSWQVYRDG